MKKGPMHQHRVVHTLPILSLVLAAASACSTNTTTPAGTAGSGANTGGAVGSAGTPGTPSGGTTGSSGSGPASGGAPGSAGTGGDTTGAGGTGTGGTGTGTGGTTCVSGVAGSGGFAGMSGPIVPSTATRPQLMDTDAANNTVLKYLAQAGTLNGTPLVPDDWGVTAMAGVGDVCTFTATSTVGASGATYTTVQAAINAATGTDRVYIQVLPGTYRETVCVPSAGPPITLYSTDPDPSHTVIAFNNYANAPVAGATINTCAAPAAAATVLGTSGSATFAAFRAGFQAKNLTFSNDFAEGAVTSGIQAVALMTQADRLIFENVRVLGNQDTLYVKSGNVNTVARAYFKGCYVEGDVDFIFGRATFVLDGCTIQYLQARRTAAAQGGGDIVSPSTDWRNPYGTLIINSNFTAEAGTAANSVALGRAWDEGQAAIVDPTVTNPYLTLVATGMTTPATTAYPNGQLVIRNSTLGAHIRLAAPWVPAASSNRAYSSTDVPAAGSHYPANRLFEYLNVGPGSGG
jgi:pectinesterase